MNEKIKDHARARDYFESMIYQIGRDIEPEVAEKFREARRLKPEGVDEGEFQESVLDALRSWINRGNPCSTPTREDTTPSSLPPARN